MFFLPCVGQNDIKKKRKKNSRGLTEQRAMQGRGEVGKHASALPEPESTQNHTDFQDYSTWACLAWEAPVSRLLQVERSQKRDSRGLK